MKLLVNSVLLSLVYFLVISQFSHVKSSRVTIRNNGYTHVTVSLPDDVKVDNRAAVVQSVKDIFEFSSKVLYVATKRRAYFKEVVLVFPSSWNVGDITDANVTLEETNGGQEARRNADVEISEDLSRSTPHTIQAEGCGKQGTKIYLPIQYLLSEKSLREKSVQFIHHWAQYRYGVYPEGGFQYDEMYPLYYGIPGTTHIETTACANVPLNYSFANSFGMECTPEVNNETGKPITLECLPQSTEQSLLSSIMYQQALPNVAEFCDSDISLDKSHIANSPSKHNVLCSEESPWFVILRHPDFAKGRNQATRLKPQDTIFRYVHEINLRVVVAIEKSTNMQFKDQYRLVLNALSKFVLFDLPLHTELGFVYFDTNAVPGKMFVLTDDKAKLEFVESELYQDTGADAGSCTDCGISAGIELLTDEYRNGLLILLTTNSYVEDVHVLMERLDAKRIVFTAMLLANPNGREHQDITSLLQLSQPTGGKVFSLSENEEGISLSQLYMSFVQAISHFEDKNVLMLEEITPETAEVEIIFDVYESATRDFTFLISGPTFRAEESPFEEDKTFLTPPSGIPINLKKQFNVPAWVYSTPMAETGQYVFTAKWKDSVSDRVFSIAFGKPVDRDSAINVRIWTDSSHTMINHPTPIKLYAEVRNAIHPIVNADVMATVFDSKGINVSAFQLLDSGLGDPDVTSHDGIYSRYVPPLNGSETYNIFVDVTDNDNRSRISFISSEPCCGSYIQARKTQPSGTFQSVSGPLLVHIIDGFTDDIHPPNRVLDFRVTGVVMETRTYTLAWTSAGDDYDHGAAAAYRLMLFPERSEARWRFEETGIALDYNKEILHHTPTSDYGSQQNYIVQLPDTLDTGHYFIAMKAIDAKNNSGPLSNIVEIYLRNDQRNWTVACEKDSDGGNTAFSVKSDSALFIWCLFLAFYKIHNYF